MPCIRNHGWAAWVVVYASITFFGCFGLNYTGFLLYFLAEEPTDRLCLTGEESPDTFPGSSAGSNAAGNARHPVYAGSRCEQRRLEPKAWLVRLIRASRPKGRRLPSGRVLAVTPGVKRQNPCGVQDRVPRCGKSRLTPTVTSGLE